MTDPSDPIIAGDARGPHVRDAGDHLVVVNRNPGRRNALSPLYYETLLGALSRAAANRDCAAVILWGADGYFCSGGDLGQLAHRRDLPEAERRARIEALHDVMRAIKACPCPVIAAIEGGAAGAGLSLALACDLAIASDTATFSAAYVKAGLVPDGGLTYSLSKSLPPATARRIVLFGDPIDARELARFGLINDCVAPGKRSHTPKVWPGASPPAPAPRKPASRR
ncbi:enoyl-CoA hydratase-related protein [Breoghania sp. L-A4]|uniref:enoyl-CoA hydratase-related protein n=1 Tax=Breoghania sp. L-A4 TaxID=2304600 RepID=UPI00196704A3|nr:enoyl-CoA hydratase-related protein [Breoghania sp. L-A4]